jgi:hypothetical protein
MVQWNLSNPTHQGTSEMCWHVQNVGILRFYFRNNLGQSIFVRCHRMSANPGVGLHKFHINAIYYRNKVISSYLSLEPIVLQYV